VEIIGGTFFQKPEEIIPSILLNINFLKKERTGIIPLLSGKISMLKYFPNCF
jgi:hypothetical protein